MRASLLPLSLFLLHFSAASLTAHEMGQTTVNVFFAKEGTYRIEMRVDPETLLERLESTNGSERSEGLPAGELARRLVALQEPFLQNVVVRFDTVRSQPRFSYSDSTKPVAAADGTPAGSEGIVRLSGEVPPGAKTFVWSYRLIYSQYPVIVTTEGKAPVTQWVDGDSETAPFELVSSSPRSLPLLAFNYLKLGFTHILPKGLDHILFVLGILLLSPRLRPIVTQVTAFTIAHSITLGLTMYGILALSSDVVEPLIALSIVYVGVENLFLSELKPWRAALVSAFGLLHGMGFAGVLEEIGIPKDDFLTALLMFNVGVELGQLTVIAIAFLLLVSWSRNKPWYRQRVARPASLLIALMGVYWTIERIWL